MPKRISAADATPIRVVVVTMDSHLASATGRARDCAAAGDSGPRAGRARGGRMEHRRRCAGALSSRHRARRHRHRHDALPRGSHPRRDAVSRGTQGRLRCDAVRHVGGRGRAAHASRQVEHERGDAGRARLAQAIARQSIGPGLERPGADEDAAAAAAGCCASFPARRRICAPTFSPCNTGWPARRKTSPTWSACSSSATPTGLVRICGASCTRRRPSTIRRSDSITRARGCASASGLEHLPRGGKTGVVGLLVMRSYVLAGNTAHYDGVIAALEAKGLRVIPAFASGLDARPAMQRYFLKGSRPIVDAVVSLTGFSLVGGPAYNDARAAEDDAGCARRAVHRGPPGRVPDAAAMAGRRARPDAGRSDDDGRDPRARRRNLADDVRRPVVRGGRRWPAGHVRACASGPRCWRRGWPSWSRCVARRAPNARSQSYCSTFRPMAAAPARRPIFRSTPRCIEPCCR